MVAKSCTTKRMVETIETRTEFHGMFTTYQLVQDFATIHSMSWLSPILNPMEIPHRSLRHGETDMESKSAAPVSPENYDPNHQPRTSVNRFCWWKLRDIFGDDIQVLATEKKTKHMCIYIIHKNPQWQVISSSSDSRPTLLKLPPRGSNPRGNAASDTNHNLVAGRQWLGPSSLIFPECKRTKNLIPRI